MSNRLAHESSLYLRQHATNPVHWWPWGEAAFVAAQAQNKPVLVSVGYSSCHWCHVMARESFEQGWIAELMNQHFVCIKVDREEHPEVDKLMMDAVQMIQEGRGGWPLNCFCLPDGRPFFGGTYFPPEDRGHGLTPWPQLLMRVADFYHRNKSELTANADAIAKNLTHLIQAPEADGSVPDEAALLTAARDICAQHDDTFGGFGGAPKFPSPHTLNFLLGVRSLAAVETERALATRIDSVLTITLGAMARGGLYDQIGGGFHRYCVDRDWVVPHFEKMLYDNGQLLGLYAEAWARYRDPLYAEVCAETIEWLQREMRTPNGLYAASLDADTDHHEGTTYVWKAAEIAAALGPEALPFAQAYGISDQGNFEGANIPRLRGGPEHRQKFTAARARLLALRNQRAQPARDPKNLLGWNALVVAGLAKAAWIFGRKDWFALATAMERTLWDIFVQEQEAGLRVFAVGQGDQATLPGTLADYAWLAEAEFAVDAYAAWGAPELAHGCKARALKLLAAAGAQFSDPHLIGYFMVGQDRTDLSVRQKEWFDNAVPAGNSSLLHGLAAAYTLTGTETWRHELTELAKAYGGMVRNVPAGIGHALDGWARYLNGHQTIKGGEGWDDVRQVLLGDAQTPPHQKPFHQLFLLPTKDLRGYQSCRGQTCAPPVRHAEELRRP